MQHGTLVVRERGTTSALLLYACGLRLYRQSRSDKSQCIHAVDSVCHGLSIRRALRATINSIQTVLESGRDVFCASGDAWPTTTTTNPTTTKY